MCRMYHLFVYIFVCFLHYFSVLVYCEKENSGMDFPDGRGRQQNDMHIILSWIDLIFWHIFNISRTFCAFWFLAVFYQKGHKKVLEILKSVKKMRSKSWRPRVVVLVDGVAIIIIVCNKWLLRDLWDKNTTENNFPNCNIFLENILLPSL